MQFAAALALHFMWNEHEAEIKHEIENQQQNPV
jgi:hypothetical protein